MGLTRNSIFSIVAIAALLAFSPNFAAAATTAGAAKTVKECDAEYAANKAAIQGGGQKKADFITACRAGSEVIPGGAASTTPATATPVNTAATTTTTVKTAKECDAEYAANKAIQGAGQKKADFVKACRAGTEVIPTAASTTTPAATTTTTPTATVTTSNTRPPKTTPPPAATTAPAGANEFATEALAKAHCPAGVVVWVNLKSKIWHWAGTKDYGTTEKGAYMCETDATAAGDRAAKNEKAPS